MRLISACRPLLLLAAPAAAAETAQQAIQPLLLTSLRLAARPAPAPGTVQPRGAHVVEVRRRRAGRSSATRCAPASRIPASSACSRAAGRPETGHPRRHGWPAGDRGSRPAVRVEGQGRAPTSRSASCTPAGTTHVAMTLGGGGGAGRSVAGPARRGHVRVPAGRGGRASGREEGAVPPMVKDGVFKDSAGRDLRHARRQRAARVGTVALRPGGGAMASFRIPSASSCAVGRRTARRRGRAST